VLPSLVPPELAQYHLLDGTRLGVAAGAVIGLLGVSLANALLHRAYHRYDPLWRWVHQLHHSPQRVDAVGGVVFSPLEVVLNVAMFQAVTVFLLGLDPLAAAIAGYLAAFIGLFPHFNIRTPQWLGYVVQRPESHCVHHRRGAHAYNYSDLPVWDLLMGTFRNPREFNGEVGFDGEAATRIGPMIAGRDVNARALGAASRGSIHPEANPA
jgi:sterol desaturase/sphingolipid hydroxylase (fatty acid hydroxylase superfamily)